MIPYEKEGAFYFPVRVYYEDTDAGGVVYHGNYLNFCERARTEWLRYHGIGQEQLKKDIGVIFVARRASLDYRRPVRLDDLIVVESRVLSMGAVRLTLRQTILKENKAVATVEIELVCIDSAFAPTQIPGIIRERLPAAPPHA
ncbi:MAG: tol-pal system-associated acyl-CoA thioesterase [Alphaproteobacteria bacterium]